MTVLTSIDAALERNRKRREAELHERDADGLTQDPDGKWTYDPTKDSRGETPEQRRRRLDAAAKPEPETPKNGIAGSGFKVGDRVEVWEMVKPGERNPHFGPGVIRGIDDSWVWVQHDWHKGGRYTSEQELAGWLPRYLRLEDPPC